MSRKSEYYSWQAIKNRCFNKNNPSYPAYGGAGISMAPEFADSFEAFLVEIGEKPKDGKQYSVDRIDNTEGYVHGNIQWATREQQNRNQGKRVTNTSGATGVLWKENFSSSGVSTTYAIASWRCLNGQSRSKAFSVKKYGLLESFAMAVQWRKKMIQDLNEQGADYSCNHGM